MKKLFLLAATALMSVGAWAQEVTWPLPMPSTVLTDIGITTTSTSVTMDANGGWFYLLNQSGNYAALSSGNILKTSAEAAEPVFVNGQTGWEGEVHIKTTEGYLYMPGKDAWTTNTNGASNASNMFWKAALTDGKYKINNQGKHKSDNKFLAPNGNGANQILYADKTSYTQWSLVPAYKAALIGRMNQYYAAYIQDKSTADATALKTSLEAVYNAIKDIQITTESDYNTYFGQIQKAVAKVNANEVLVNPGFESCSIAGWTNDGSAKLGQLSTAPANNPKTGRWFVEVYGSAGKIDFNQTTPELTAGMYKVGVSARNETGQAVYVYGNESKAEIAANNTTQYYANVYLKNDGTIKLGVKSDNHPASTWFAIDDFTLEYLGNKISYAATELPNTDVEAGDWYSYAINVEGDYKITSSAAATIKYTQDGTLDPSADGTSLVFEAGETKIVSALAVGNLYLNSNAATTITVAPNTMSYSVGAATVDMTSVQAGKVVTITYADATTNDADATLALNGVPAITFGGNAISVTATANGFTFIVPEVEASSSYTLSIPANAFGYAAGSTFNEAQNFDFTTPAIFDQVAYIYSPKAGKFVSRGDAYGTAAILDSYGIPVQIATDGAGNTTFKFVDNQRYLYGNDWAYTDGDARNYTVAAVGEGYTFTSNGMPFYVNGTRCANNGIKGDNYTDDDMTIWQIKTRAERDEMKAANQLADLKAIATAAGENIATEEAFVSLLDSKVSSNQTSKVKGAELKDALDAAWTATNVRNNKSAYSINGNGVEFYESAEKITQTVTGLEAGIYKVTLNGFARFGSSANCDAYAEYDLSTAYLKANDYQVNIKPWVADREGDNPHDMGQARAKFDAGKYLNTLYTYVGEDGNLKLTIDNPNFMGAGWMMFKNLTLTYYGGTAAVEADYTALASAITAAEAKTLGFAEGEYAPYTNIDAIKALSAAKAFDTEATNLQSDVQAATQALNDATWTANTEEMNAIYDGGFSLTTKQEGGYLVPTGWTNLGYNTRVYNDTNKGSNTGVEAGSENGCLFAKYETSYGAEAGYTMPLKAGVYSLSFIYGGWNDLGSRTITLTKSGTTVTPFDTNKVTAKENHCETNAEGWESYNGKFIIPEDGNYIFNVNKTTNGQNQIVISDIKIFAVPVTEIAGTKVAATNKWGTFISEIDRELPDNLTAYTCSEISETSLTLVESTEIKANTPYLLQNTTSKDITIDAKNAQSLKVADSYTKGLLTGTYKQIVGVETGKYLLQNQDGKVGFYKVTKDNLKLGANRCYLTAPAASPVKAFYFDEETAIKALDALTSGKAEIFDMNGRKLSKMQKGVNIVNGVKVLVK